MDDGGQFFKNYAQVSFPGRLFGSALQAPTPLELPFVVRGKLRDSDLVAIVDLVRLQQQKEASGKVDLLEHADGSIEEPDDLWVTSRPAQPIGHVEQQADGSIEVSTVQENASWRVFRLARSHRVWKIVEESEANA